MIVENVVNGGSVGSPGIVHDHLGTLREDVARAAVDLCVEYGMAVPKSRSVNRTRSDEHWVTFLAIVGFASPLLSGQAIFEVDEQILMRSNPTRSSPQDWMTELANQFLGRLKNLLLRQGIPVQRIPPLVLRTCVSPFLNGRHGPPVLVLGGQPQGTIMIWVKAEPAIPVRDDDAGNLLSAEDRNVLAEGEMVLF
jgi:hypothetical protein